MPRDSWPQLPTFRNEPERFEKLYRMLLDSIPSSVLLVDASLRVVSANQNFVTRSRLSEPEVLGQRLEDVFPPVISQHMNLRQRVAEVFRTGEPLKGERLTYRAPGLPTRIYYYSLVPFHWEGRTENVMLLMEDVTDKVRLGEEARRAERHLASVVESASDLVVSTDLAGRVLTWNTAAARVTGLEEVEVLGRPLPELCQEEFRGTLARWLDQVPWQGRTDPVEAELVARDGRAVPIAWVCSPMRDADGRATGLVAVGRDLTERRKFEAQLLRSEKLAALGVMAGGIAHEVRNPLAVVSSAAQMLLAGGLPADFQAECAQKIHEGVRRASAVIESLLRFARPSDKGAREPLDLASVVREACGLVAHQLKLARAESRLDLPDGPVPLRGSPALLQQLVTNLLLNAANALPEEGGSIRVGLSRERGIATLSVADTGRGIPAGDLARVFDPFFTTMPVGRGTGLGLSICYAITQHHDGAIEIASGEGAGTTVTVRLPLAEGGGGP